MYKYNKLANIFLLICYCFIFFVLGFFLSSNQTLNELLNDFNQKIHSAYSLEKNKSLDQEITVWTDQNNKRHNGLILLSTNYINNPSIILTNAKGDVLHSWNVKKEFLNKNILEVHKKHINSDKESIYGIDDAYLLPDGSIIFAQSFMEFDNYRSQQIAKMDKNSNIIWQQIGLFHHDMFLSDNKIYTIGSVIKDDIEYINKTKKSNHTNFILGVIKILSQDGKLLQEINVEEAFLNSKYKHFLSLFRIDIKPQKFRLGDGNYLLDPIHLNSVQPINKVQASKIDFLKTGDLLISTRGNSTIAILRPDEKKIIWATRGPWRNQHYVRMDSNGLIYIYDNEGDSKIIDKGLDNEPIASSQPRIISFNLSTNKSKVVLENNSGYNMSSYWRGYYKKLSNNTMIISSSEQGTILQLDEKGQSVWELRTVKERESKTIPYTKKITSVKYYEKEYINFLDPDTN